MDKYIPSLQEIEAVITAWNRAEDRPGGRGPLIGTSYYATVVEMLTAAHTARNPVTQKGNGHNPNCSPWCEGDHPPAPEGDNAS